MVAGSSILRSSFTNSQADEVSRTKRGVRIQVRIPKCRLVPDYDRAAGQQSRDWFRSQVPAGGRVPQVVYPNSAQSSFVTDARPWFALIVDMFAGRAAGINILLRFGTLLLLAEDPDRNVGETDSLDPGLAVRKSNNSELPIDPGLPCTG